MINWQPKETAPKDGTEVLVKSRWGHLYLAYWSEEAHLGHGDGVGPAWQGYYCDDDPYYPYAIEDQYVISWAKVHPD